MAIMKTILLEGKQGKVVAVCGIRFSCIVIYWLLFKWMLTILLSIFILIRNLGNFEFIVFILIGKGLVYIVNYGLMFAHSTWWITLYKLLSAWSGGWYITFTLVCIFIVSLFTEFYGQRQVLEAIGFWELELLTS